MESTMQDVPLTITHLFRHGLLLHRRSEIVTNEGDHYRRSTFSEVGGRTAQLANALARLGVRPDDRVGTVMWNGQEHLEAYFAVPCSGAVIHTANPRLSSAQLAGVINHAEDSVLMVYAGLLPALLPILRELRTVRHVIVAGRGREEVVAQAAQLDHPFEGVWDYEELLAAESDQYEWPDLDERSAAGLCYTSGTTGDPKGVAYSHRSQFLHAFGISASSALGMTERDRYLIIVPMFHVNAWGAPYAGWAAGADLVLPGPFMQPEALCGLIQAARPTVSGGVPSVWGAVLRYGMEHPEVNLGDLRQVTAGGAATPRSLLEEFEARFGVRMLAGWGMTETSPVCTLASPPREVDPDDVVWRLKAGRVIAGVELRVVDPEGNVLPNDGLCSGEIEVRGPWVTGSYYKNDSPESFHDGWLRTGDIGTLDEYGCLSISDRLKDVIKSGGEWISSVELENELMANPAVVEAAVIGVADEQWGERPLAVVVPAGDAGVTPRQLWESLEGKVAGWWRPERWAFVEELPKTSVGKFDKRLLRARYEHGDLSLEHVAKDASSDDGQTEGTPGAGSAGSGRAEHPGK